MKNFEQRLTRLEELAGKISEGDVPLEDAVNMFEEGIKLAQGLEKDLAKVERKIEILVNQPDKQEDEPNLELFPELEDDQE
jgi:exodeoxyribonuclease VII small subunit